MRVQLSTKTKGSSVIAAFSLSRCVRLSAIMWMSCSWSITRKERETVASALQANIYVWRRFKMLNKLKTVNYRGAKRASHSFISRQCLNVFFSVEFEWNKIYIKLHSFFASVHCRTLANTKRERKKRIHVSIAAIILPLFHENLFKFYFFFKRA